MFEWFDQWIHGPDFTQLNYSWLLSPAPLWFCVFGDSLFVFASLSGLFALVYFACQPSHLQYRGILLSLGGLVAACGAAYGIKIWSTGVRAFWWAGWLNVFVGFIAAACTAMMWWRLRTLSTGHPSPRIERDLAQLNRELEQRVEERTEALETSNRELAQQVVMREYVQQELRSSNENLNRYVEELERQNEDISWLNVLSDQLHCCDTHSDLVRILECHCKDFFGAEGGALFEWQEEQLALKSSWGCWMGAARSFPPEALLALRLGRLFPDSAEEQNLVPAARSDGGYMLLAGLQSRGQGIGALVLQRLQPFWTGTTALDDRVDQLLHALADHTALALSNLMLRERLREQSLSDPLTGLYNRRYLFQQLARLIALWERGGQAFAIILIDVDHFKSFNDRFGHDVGDDVLLAIADVLQSEVRKSDIACRMGGEEFVVLMAGASAELARERAESLRAAVKALKVARADGEVVTISAGVALYPSHGADAFSLVRAADQALYESKRAGRDRISVAPAECD